MFCSFCGAEISQIGKYCHSCGINVRSETNKRRTGVSFETFRENKEKERRGKFRPPRRSKAVGPEKKSIADVTIQIGMMKFRDGGLKSVRGISLPLKVNPSIELKELLTKGAEKMIKFNKDLITFTKNAFTLLYPDRSEVNYLPGSQELFSLSRYKEELGKSYQRITLYLCLKTDYNKAVFQLGLEDYSDLDDNDEKVNTNLASTTRQSFPKSLGLAPRLIRPCKKK